MKKKRSSTPSGEPALVKRAAFSEDGTVQRWTAPRLKCAAIIFCATGAALAQSPVSDGPFNVALEYQPVVSCPDVVDFKAMVAKRLGRDPFQKLAGSHVVIRITSSNSVAEGRVEWRDRAGKWAGDQAFPPRAGACHELALEMALALAVQIELLDRSGASDVSDAPTESTPPGHAQHVELPAQSSGPTPIERGIRLRTEARGGGHRISPAFSLGTGASVGLGMSANAVALARVFARLAWSSASVELAGEAGLPSTTRREDGAGFSQRVLLVGAAGCGIYERWRACLVAQGGEVRVHGRGIDLPTSSSGTLLQTGLRLAASQRLGASVYLDARADGLLNLTTWSVDLDREPVWVAPRLTETLGFDFGVFLP